MRRRSRRLAFLGLVGLLIVSGTSIEAKETEKIDTTQAPSLTITEILPDSSNVGGADAYEFVEVFNNADRSINLKAVSYTHLVEGITKRW